MPESLSASDFAKPKILDLFQEHRIAPRADSAAFLIWFLENYYRLDPIEAIDAVTDRGGDKGIDGIFVNDSEESITIFASRIFDNANKEVGDKALLHLAGAISQFRDRRAVENLIATGGDARVAQLAKRAEVPKKLADGYSVQGIFLTNALVHKNGKDFLDGAPDVRFIGQKYLIARFVSGERTKPIHKPIKFNVRGLQAAQYSVEDIKTLIVPVKASELGRVHTNAALR